MPDSDSELSVEMLERIAISLEEAEKSLKFLIPKVLELLEEIYGKKEAKDND